MRLLTNFSRPPVIALFALVLSCAGCRKKVDPQAAAQQFFDLVTSGHADQAYSSSSFAFQAQQSDKAFETRAKELGLVGAKVQLQPGEISDKTAKFTAQVSPTSGDKYALVVTLEADAGQWRLFSLKTPRNPETGITENRFSLVGKTSGFNEAIDQRMPDEAAVRQLVHDAMKKFSDAIATKSFTEFYEYTAQAWQTQLTEKKLHQAFQAFIDKDVRLGGALEAEPTFEVGPQMTTDGLLMVGGYYPTQPFQVYFSLKFIYELPNWKLFGLDVYLKRAPEVNATAPAATPGAP